MAVYNEIGIGRWNRFIQKLTDIKGGPPARQLSSEIAFNHSIFAGRETFYLQGWERFGCNATVNGLAGNTSGARLRNPAGSNIIAVIEKIALSTNVADQAILSLGPIGTDLATVFGSGRLDPRGQRFAGICIPSAANTSPAQPGNTIGRLNTLVLTNLDVILEELQTIPLLPGDAFQFTTVNVSVTINCTFFWRERFLEPSERT